MLNCRYPLNRILKTICWFEFGCGALVELGPGPAHTPEANKACVGSSALEAGAVGFGIVAKTPTIGTQAGTVFFCKN